MFSSGPFSSSAFSVTDDVIPSGVTGGDVIIYFNNSYMTFPLEINTQADFDLDINTQQDHSLDVNKILDFSAER